MSSIAQSGSALEVSCLDRAAGLEVDTVHRLEPSGALRVHHVVTNVGSDPYYLDQLEASLPLPGRVAEILDFSGRWCLERQPQRLPIQTGTWCRESREGRSGHDFAGPVMALTPGTGFRRGEAWAVSLAWSGNARHFVERLADGSTRIGAGELLLPGEVVLGPGESYEMPRLVCAYSDRGLDGISAAYHGFLRARARHPTESRPRPLTLDTWEAVYFDLDPGRLTELADVAAEIGVERFVLDDGWFRGRTNDSRALGDWCADDERWPDGLTPLISHVRARGMEFGLWVEPEMLSLDSETYHRHPEWLMTEEGRVPPSWRHQQVLDLSNDEAFAYIFERLDTLVLKYEITFLKWDHNRGVVGGGHDGRASIRAQTLAVYRLMDALKGRHVDLEIESCASGGGRADLGIIDHTDRIWASDFNDALERQSIQLWSQIILPPEIVGTHVGPDRAHTTGRRLDLSFRAATSLFGHAGIECDITKLGADERAELKKWAAYYKTHRGLLHSGQVVRSDHANPSALLYGVVALDGSEALYQYAQLRPSRYSVPPRITLEGLSADERYSVRVEHPAGAAWTMQKSAPPWVSVGVVMTGRMLATAGLPVPILGPEQALIVIAERVEPGLG